MDSLAVTPLAFADSPILFADYAGSRAATGLEGVQGIDDVLSAENPDAMRRIYEGIAIDVDFLSRTVTLKDRVGLDVYAFDRSIWSSEPRHEAPGFLLIQGKFDIENVIDNLMELDYTKDSHMGADYYRLGDDFGYSIAHPLRGLGLTLNRVAWLDPWLAAARSTGIVAGLIDVQRGRASGLLTSESHRALAEAVGEGLTGGAFLPPQWVLENWNTVNTGPVERLDRYMKGAGRWDRLSPYSLALFGYRAWEDAEETVVALFYTDPTAAEHDAKELKKRWDGFHYTTDRSNGRDPGSPGNGVLFPLFHFGFPAACLFGAGGNLSRAPQQSTRPDRTGAFPVVMAVRRQGTPVSGRGFGRPEKRALTWAVVKSGPSLQAGPQAGLLLCGRLS